MVFSPLFQAFPTLKSHMLSNITKEHWGVVKGTFGTFGTAKSLALDEILG